MKAMFLGSVLLSNKRKDGKKEKGYHTVGAGISDPNPQAQAYQDLGQPLRYYSFSSPAKFIL